MLHLRSNSDPPLSPSTLGSWDLPVLMSRPVTPLALQPHDADAYVKRPLPPLPPMKNSSAVVPPPLKINKKRSKPAALPVGPGPKNAPQIEAGPESRIASPSPAPSPRQAPSTPVKNALPPRQSSLPSPVASLRHRKSKKVLQLMGLDVDVTNLAGITSQEAEKEAVTRSSRSFEDPSAPNPAALLQLPEEGLIPVLEDDDGMASLSSKKSSWGPGSPHSTSAFPLGSKNSVRRRRSARIFDQDGLGHLAAQEDSFVPSNEEEELGDESDEDLTAGEYHKFAVELASSAVPKTSLDEVNAAENMGRRSSILSFKSGSHFSRLRRKATTSIRPNTADPHSHSRRVGSSGSVEIPPVPALPPAEPAEPEEPSVPKSAFDESDSDSDSRPNSRSRWRNRSSHKEERGRDSPAMVRRDDESSLSRGWAKTGDSMNRLLTVGRRRRDQQQAGVVSENVFA
ncbi:hypothetical protein Trisim1_002488 [Trichoderma cf. simile WF8]|uniref:Uncharacterized protein n=1 Tax=Trichoderma guizhouense TaxID=1491466 RepID=A0A1T3CPF1_9HYPO|nr:hypothetical protein A0O28_0085770 [Trichoderma guizhouense]